MFASIPLACYFVLVVMLLLRRQITGRHIVVMAFLWILGALPYEYLIIKDIAARGDFWLTMSSAAFGEVYKDRVLNMSLSGRIIKENFLWIALNFPTPNALLAFIGISAVHSACRKRWFANIILALTALVVDRYVFFIPFYCMVSILIGAGACKILSRRHDKITGRVIVLLCLLTVPAYVAAPAIAEHFKVMTRPRKIPYRNDYTYFLRPWKTGYKGTEKFADEFFDLAEPNAFIFADSTTAPPLLYTQEVKSRRSDIKIISSTGHNAGAPQFNEQTVDEVLAERTVYVVSPSEGYCPNFLLERCTFLKAGPVWLAMPK